MAIEGEGSKEKREGGNSQANEETRTVVETGEEEKILHRVSFHNKHIPPKCTAGQRGYEIQPRVDFHSPDVQLA